MASAVKVICQDGLFLLLNPTSPWRTDFPQNKLSHNGTRQYALTGSWQVVMVCIMATAVAPHA
jgi:hypothetical protein